MIGLALSMVLAVILIAAAPYVAHLRNQARQLDVEVERTNAAWAKDNRRLCDKIGSLNARYEQLETQFNIGKEQYRNEQKLRVKSDRRASAYRLGLDRVIGISTRHMANIGKRMVREAVYAIEQGDKA